MTLRRARAEVAERFVITCRVPEEEARARLPSFLEPDLVDGSAVWASCPYVLSGLRGPGLPRGVGLRAVCSAPRLSALQDGRPVAYVLWRDTSRRAVGWAAAGLLGLRFVVQTGSVVRHADGWTVAIGERDHGRGLHVDLGVGGAVRRSGGLFAGPEAFAKHFSCGSAWSPVAGGEYTRLDLTATGTAWEAVPVEAALIGGLPPGSVVDAAYVGRGGSYEWRAGPRQHRAG